MLSSLLCTIFFSSDLRDIGQLRYPIVNCSMGQTEQNAYSAHLWLEIPSTTPVFVGQIIIQLTTQNTLGFW